MSPVAGVRTNPLKSLRWQDMVAVLVGSSLAELAADMMRSPDGLLLCKLNGEYISRLTEEQRKHVQALRDAGAGAVADEQFRVYALAAENWSQVRVGPNDVVEWSVEPAGRDAVRLVLQVAVLALSIYTGGATGAAIGLVGNLAIQFALPPRQPSAGDQPGSVFSTSLAGNDARLDQPIPKICGRVKFTPPFATIPYVRYLPKDPSKPTKDCDQWYYGLFALSLGNVIVEKAMIGKTSIQHFQDVTRSDLLAPGVQPSEVKANVLTSQEISSSELTSEETGDFPDIVFSARYVGGITGCRPGDRFKRFSIDVGASQGLGRTTSGGDSGTRTAQWQVEERAINDFGAPVGPWIVVANESRTDDTNTPQRWTSDYELSDYVRGQVRLLRTDVKATEANKRDSIEWIGFRVELERNAGLNPSATHFEVVMRASEQLSQQSGRDFSMIVRGLCRTWDPVGGWGPQVFTRNAAWWLADLLTSDTETLNANGDVIAAWGLGLPDDRIDLQSIYDWALVLDARQDHFDYAFTESMDGWEAAQLIARSGRARVFRRNGIVSVVRDELVDMPVTAFTPRNTIPGSMALQANLPGREQPNGIVVEFLSNITWDTATVECPCPGFSVTNPSDPRYAAGLPPMDRPIFRRYEGITGSKHAEREGLYDAADMRYRNTTASCKVEMEQHLVAYLDPIRWMPDFAGYGQSGDVAFWNPTTLVMGLTEPPDWTQAPLTLTLRRDDGSLTDPVEVSAGPTANDVVLPAAPDFELVLDSGTRERPQFLLGHVRVSDELVKVVGVNDGGEGEGGEQLADVLMLLDDDRVHTYDNHLLPGPDEIQDPIDDGYDYSDDVGGGFATLVRLRGFSAFAGNPGLPDDSYRGGKASVTMSADGGVRYALEDGATSPTLYSGDIAGMWVNTWPAEPSFTSGYECMAFDSTGSAASLIAAGATVTGVFNTWLPLSSSRTWSVAADNAVCSALFGADKADLAFRMRVRRVSDSVEVENRLFLLEIQFNDFGHGFVSQAS